MDSPTTIEKNTPSALAAEILRCATDLLNELETGTSSISVSLMKAKRLARLMRDENAQKWLTFEMSGYPQGFFADSIGTYKKFAEEGGRILPDGKYYAQSLPEIEASVMIGDLEEEGTHLLLATRRIQLSRSKWVPIIAVPG